MVKKPLKVMQEPDDIGLDASCDNKDCKDYSQELFSFDSKQPSSPSPEDAYDDTLTNIQFTEISISTANLINDSGESRQSSTVGPSPSDISGFNLLPSSHASDMTPLIRQKSLENIKRTDGAVSWAYNGTDMEGHGAFGTEWLLAGDTKERCLGWTTGLKVTDNGFLYVPRLMEPQPVRGPELRPSWVDIWKGH